jgi:hypothetical protein
VPHGCPAISITANKLHLAFSTTRIKPQPMQTLRFSESEFHVMPFAIVLHLEVEMLAFGEDGFGVGGPKEFGWAGGLALESEFEGVGAGL